MKKIGTGKYFLYSLYEYHLSMDFSIRTNMMDSKKTSA